MEEQQTAAAPTTPVVVYLNPSALASPSLARRLQCPDGAYCDEERTGTASDQEEELGPEGGVEDMRDKAEDDTMTCALMESLPEEEKRALDEFIVDTSDDDNKPMSDAAAHNDMIALAAYSLFNEQTTLQQRLEVLARKYESIRRVAHDFTMFFTQLLVQMKIVHTNESLLSTVAGRCTSCILSDYVQYGPHFMTNTPKPSTASRSLLSLKDNIKAFLTATHPEDGSTIATLKTQLTNIFYDFIHVVQYMPYGYSDRSKNALVYKLVLVCLPYVRLSSGKRIAQTEFFAKNKTEWMHSIEYSMYQGVHDVDHVDVKEYPLDLALDVCCRLATIDLHKNHVALTIRRATTDDIDTIAVETLNAPPSDYTTIVVYDDTAHTPLVSLSVFYRTDYVKGDAVPPVACVGLMRSLVTTASTNNPSISFSLYKLALVPVLDLCVHGLVDSVVYTVDVPRAFYAASMVLCAMFGCTFYPDNRRFKPQSLTGDTLMYTAYWSSQDEAAMIMYRLAKGVLEMCGSCVVNEYRAYYDDAAASQDVTGGVDDYFACTYGCHDEDEQQQSPSHRAAAARQRRYYTEQQAMERDHLLTTLAEHKKTVMKKLYG